MQSSKNPSKRPTEVLQPTVPHDIYVRTSTSVRPTESIATQITTMRKRKVVHWWCFGHNRIPTLAERGNPAKSMRPRSQSRCWTLSAQSRIFSGAFGHPEPRLTHVVHVPTLVYVPGQWEERQLLGNLGYYRYRILRNNLGLLIMWEDLFGAVWSVKHGFVQAGSSFAALSAAIETRNGCPCSKVLQPKTRTASFCFLLVGKNRHDLTCTPIHHWLVLTSHLDTRTFRLLDNQQPFHHTHDFHAFHESSELLPQRPQLRTSPLWLRCLDYLQYCTNQQLAVSFLGDRTLRHSIQSPNCIISAVTNRPFWTVAYQKTSQRKITSKNNKETTTLNTLPHHNNDEKTLFYFKQPKNQHDHQLTHRIYSSSTTLAVSTQLHNAAE